MRLSHPFFIYTLVFFCINVLVSPRRLPPKTPPSAPKARLTRPSRALHPPPFRRAGDAPLGPAGCPLPPKNASLPHLDPQRVTKKVTSRIKKLAEKFGLRGKKCVPLHPLSGGTPGRNEERSLKLLVQHTGRAVEARRRKGSVRRRDAPAGTREKNLNTMKSLILAQDER